MTVCVELQRDRDTFVGETAGDRGGGWVGGGRGDGGGLCRVSVEGKEAKTPHCGVSAMEKTARRTFAGGNRTLFPSKNFKLFSYLRPLTRKQRTIDQPLLTPLDQLNLLRV